ncbi:hypothetical protein S83_020802 [Arachis hypogaea]
MWLLLFSFHFCVEKTHSHSEQVWNNLFTDKGIKRYYFATNKENIFLDVHSYKLSTELPAEHEVHKNHSSNGGGHCPGGHEFTFECSSVASSLHARHRLHGFSGCPPALEIAAALGIELKFNSNYNGGSGNTSGSRKGSGSCRRWQIRRARFR